MGGVSSPVAGGHPVSDAILTHQTSDQESPLGIDLGREAWADVTVVGRYLEEAVLRCQGILAMARPPVHFHKTSPTERCRENDVSG